MWSFRNRVQLVTASLSSSLFWLPQDSLPYFVFLIPPRMCYAFSHGIYLSSLPIHSMLFYNTLLLNYKLLYHGLSNGKWTKKGHMHWQVTRHCFSLQNHYSANLASLLTSWHRKWCSQRGASSPSQHKAFNVDCLWVHPLVLVLSFCRKIVCLFKTHILYLRYEFKLLLLLIPFPIFSLSSAPLLFLSYTHSVSLTHH